MAFPFTPLTPNGGLKEALPSNSVPLLLGPPFQRVPNLIQAHFEEAPRLDNVKVAPSRRVRNSWLRTKRSICSRAGARSSGSRSRRTTPIANWSSTRRRFAQSALPPLAHSRQASRGQAVARIGAFAVWLFVRPFLGLRPFAVPAVLSPGPSALHYSLPSISARRRWCSAIWSCRMPVGQRCSPSRGAMRCRTRFRAIHPY